MGSAPVPAKVMARSGPRVARRILVGVVALVAGGLLVPKAFSPVHGGLLPRLHLVGIGWAFIAGGLAASIRRPENRTGLLLTMAGFAWWVPLLTGTRVPVLWTLGSTVELAFLPVLFMLFVTFPEGRLASPRDRALVGYGVFIMLIANVAFSPFYDPAAFGCPDCQDGLNLVLWRSDPDLVRDAQDVTLLFGIAGMVALIATMVARWIRSTVPRRRVLAPIVIPGAAWALAYLTYLVFQRLQNQEIYAPPRTAYTILIDTFLFALLMLPATFLIGLTRYRARRARVSDLVVELGELTGPVHLQDALRRTLGDPALIVGFWVPARGRYVTAEGAPLAVPDGDEPAATFLARGGEPLAVIVHDRALLDDPALVDAVAAAARLAVENDRLQAEIRTQLEEVRASRARIVEATDAERRRVERDLHDGAQARLVALSLALQVAQSRLETVDTQATESLADAVRELEVAIDELRRLARGIHPSILTEAGLEAALESLAEIAAVPVTIVEVTRRRFDPVVEAAAYFITAEAITNAAKHADATEVSVRVNEDAGMLILDIRDDGRGGASFDAGGSGLRGLADRVEALDGHLDVNSPPGRGTTVIATIPCE